MVLASSRHRVKNSGRDDEDGQHSDQPYESENGQIALIDQSVKLKPGCVAVLDLNRFELDVTAYFQANREIGLNLREIRVS